MVPVMSTNEEVILRSSIPVELQERVYACRNTLQFFTIPIGMFFGGFMVDNVCEPFMVRYGHLSYLNMLFGFGKGYDVYSWCKWKPDLYYYGKETEEVSI